MSVQASTWQKITYWFKNRFRNMDLFDETLQPKHPRNPAYWIGGMLYLGLLIQILLGSILAIYYIPSFEMAYRSVESIMQLKFLGVSIGPWLRGFHRYLADTIIILAMLRVFRLYFAADHKKPHEFTWFWAVLFVVITTVFGFSGYILPLDQRAYWATTIGTTMPTFVDELPLLGNLYLGNFLQFIARGSVVICTNTITRFYALHYVLPVGIVILVESYYYFFRKKRINLPALGVIVLFAIIIVWQILEPAHSLAPADPSSPPEHILPDWYFLFVYYFLKIMNFLWGILFNIIFLVFVILMPYIERNHFKKPSKRPLWNSLLVLGYALFIILSWRAAIYSESEVLRADIPWIFGAYIVCILVFGWWQKKVDQNEKRKGELVHQK
jgi:quinol-cytochrome oxidoreductase complex cytochrome b subunit